MRLTNRKKKLKKLLHKKVYKFFLINFVDFYHVRKIFFFNDKFLTKLVRMSKLNKFET